MLMLLVALAVQAQIQDPVKFKTEWKQLTDNEVEIVFTGTIDPGWHVYSTDLGDGGPISATFNTDKLEGAELGARVGVVVQTTQSIARLEAVVSALLSRAGRRVRVVSMPCFEEFEKQSAEYKESVMPAAVKARVCVEAGSPYSWYKYAGDCGEIIGMSTFGASAPAAQLFKLFGFTVENVVEKAKASLAKAGK